jgi:protein-S-isoprenylcysteine O-methyltransferase Ste14
MALIEEMERSGNWLFKGRSYFPLALYGLIIVVIGLEWDSHFREFDATSASICLAVSMFGLLIRSLTIGYTPRGTSGRNTKDGQIAEVLNSKGMYSLVRHPLYLGNFFMWLGIMIYVGNVWFTIVCCLLYWLYYERIMFAEEAFLRKRFGDAYLAWSEYTPAFWPRSLKWKGPDVSFSMRNVLKREYNGFFAVFVSLMAISVGKNFVHQDATTIDNLLNPFWMWSTAGAFVVFIVLRSLKRYSRVLHVEGR